MDALAGVMRAVDAVMALARQDKTIRYLRDAPPDVQRLAARASKLPDAVFEVAHKIARGDWPSDEYDVDIKPKRRGPSSPRSAEPVTG